MVQTSRLLVALMVGGALLAAAGTLRLHARSRRRYVRRRIAPYRTDRAGADAVVELYEGLHKRLLQRWWRRLLVGQPSVALEAHLRSDPGGEVRAELAVSCPEHKLNAVEAALRSAYPNTQLEPFPAGLARPPYVLRLKKRAEFITRLRIPEPREPARPLMDRMLAAMQATGGPCLVQLALTPTPAWFERSAKQRFKRREQRASPELKNRERPTPTRTPPRSTRPSCAARSMFSTVPCSSRSCASWPRPGPRARTSRPCCAPAAPRTSSWSAERPSARRSFARTTAGSRAARATRCLVFSAASMPRPSSRSCGSSPRSASRPCRSNAQPSPSRPRHRRSRGPATMVGCSRDAFGPVSIHPDLRRQNTAVPGTVEQGKTSYLVATIHEDLQRERCAVIVFDPKGDAADAAIGAVPEQRTCTILDFAQPTCGFNPLAVDANPDTIADYVVAAMRNLFDEGDIRASSDRYLRNAIIAVLAYDRARHAVGRRPAALGHRGGLRLPHARRPAPARPAGVQGDRRLLHRGAARPAARRQEHDHLQARRPGQQGGAAAQLAFDQARPAEHVVDCRLRPHHRRR